MCLRSIILSNFKRVKRKQKTKLRHYIFFFIETQIIKHNMLVRNLNINTGKDYRKCKYSNQVLHVDPE